MAARYPIQYELEPRSVDAGMNWLTLHLRNMGTEELKDLDVRLNSLDTWSMYVYGTGDHILILSPSDEEVIHFQVSVIVTSRVYVSIDGRRDGEPFHWESPGVVVRVSQEPAELVSLFAMTEPYPVAGERLRCEATVRGLAESGGFRLEFWANAPSGRFDEVAVVKTKDIAPGEEVRYGAEVLPEEEGPYTLYAYLYDGAKRIGREKEYVYVRKS